MRCSRLILMWPHQTIAYASSVKPATAPMPIHRQMGAVGVCLSPSSSCTDTAVVSYLADEGC